METMKWHLCSPNEGITTMLHFILCDGLSILKGDMFQHCRRCQQNGAPWISL